MPNLDELIEEALKGQDRAILEATEEQGWFALGMSQFRGKLGWVTWVVVLMQATLFVVGIWCAVRFFGASDMLIALKWGLSGAVLMLMATILKTSLMPQMQADRILREVKRVELMIAKSSSR